jgi:hypothetical protein
LKKAAAISFLLIFLLANTELKQLLKLPVLIHHYMEHDEDDAGKSLLAFLQEHYAEEHAKAATQHHDQDHENLPFKSHQDGFSQSNFFCATPATFDYESERTIKVITNSIYIESSHCPSALSKIWQPPRIC